MSAIFAAAAAEWKRLRLEFDDYLDAVVLAAEADLNGVLLNRLGRRRGIDARSLFYGPFSRVEKYASEELYAWFQENGRVTWTEFERASTPTPS